MSTICPGPPIWTGLFTKCKTVVNVPTILVPVNYGMLAPNFQFILGVFHGHSPWLSSTPAPQIGEVICQKKLPCLMLNLFLQTFTGQRQATSWTARSKACSLQWRWQGGQTICVGSSPYCRHHLMHSWRLSIKQAPILTKDIWSKIAWSGASETAMMTEYIQNGITKWKCPKRKIKWSIENNLNMIKSGSTIA